MAKFKVRHKSGKKGRERWAKGQSSSSNPSRTKFREKAKLGLLRPARGAAVPESGPGSYSRLTAECLLKHDAMTSSSAYVGAGGAAGDAGDGDDALTLGQTCKTFDTFASDWTQCTNVSFQKVLTRFDPNKPDHREMLAVLAAVTEVIRAKGGSESATEYFAALLTTLEAADTEEAVGAVCGLLALAVKAVPEAVLQLHFGEVARLLTEALLRFASSSSSGGEAANHGGGSTLRAVIGCLAVVLRSQPAQVWQHSSTTRVLDTILSFCVHTKPKVRKAAQHAVVSILKYRSTTKTTTASAGSVDHLEGSRLHPAASTVGRFCVRAMEGDGDALAAAVTGKQSSTKTLHAMILLKEVVAVMPRPQLKACCESVLKLLTLASSGGSAVTVSCGMQVLYGLFNGRPCPRQSLPAELNAKLVSALHDYRPSANDAQPMVAWLTVMQEALINLAAISSEADLARGSRPLLMAHLPKFYGCAVACWASERPTVAVAATSAMKAVCLECVGPLVEEVAISKDAEGVGILHKVFQHIEEGLKYQYHTSWAQVLHLLATFIDIAGKRLHNFMGNCLKSLADLRGSVNFRLTNELDYVFGKAIRRMGPERLLSYVPLKITGEERDNFDFPRSWLLPVLRDNVQNTNLAFFKSYFLPLATTCRERSLRAKREGEVAISKAYEILAAQMWALLPGFCNDPTDLKETFKGLAKTLGEALQSRPDLRMDILSALRQLILKNTASGPEGSENRGELARYAKNFLPILFNLYTTKPEPDQGGQRQSVFETIKLYLTMASDDLLHEMFDRAFQKYQESCGGPEDLFMRDACLDLLQAMLVYQDSSRVDQLYRACVDRLSGPDHKAAKKSYRILEELFRLEAAACRDFVRSKLGEIQEIFIRALSKASPSSQNYRLRCLVNILRNADERRQDRLEFVAKLVPEAVLCVRATNEKARAAAYLLLVVIGETMQKWSRLDDEAGAMAGDGGGDDSWMKEYLRILLAGLAGSPNVVQCTLMAITRVFFEFRDFVSDDLADMLVENACLLLTSQSREVVGAGVSFLRVYVASYPILKTTRHVERMVAAVAGMSDDCKRHFRLKTRYLLDRLVRKFGLDLVSHLIPKGDAMMQKRLNNIRKIQQRRSKAKTGGADGDDDDDEEDDDEAAFRVRARPKDIDEILADSDSDEDSSSKKMPAKGKKGKKGQRPVIVEDLDDGGIVDLLDAKASQSLLSGAGALPKQRGKGEKDQEGHMGGFKLAPDGRIIITEDEDGQDEETEAAAAAKRNKYLMMDEDGNSEDDEGAGNNNTFQALVASSKKRKRSAGASSVASSMATTARAASVASAATTSSSLSMYRPGGSGIHRPLNGSGREAKRGRVEHPDYGAEYRAKKGKGDVKRKGKPDPYAYVPLQKSSLNRRKKAKFEGQFKGLMKAAKKGSAAGKKSSKQLASKMKKLKV